MERFADCFKYPHQFDAALKAFAAGTAGAFSFITAGSAMGPEYRWTYFLKISRFSGRAIACVSLAEDYPWPLTVVDEGTDLS